MFTNVVVAMLMSINTVVVMRILETTFRSTGSLMREGKRNLLITRLL